MVRVVKKAVLGATIKHHFYACKELYGSTRLSVELKANGTSVSRVTVSKYMKELGLRSKFYRKFRNTTDSKHDNPVAENLLDRQFVVNEPNKYWVSDITYISVVGGFEYLTTIIDLFDRKVVGYSQSQTLKAKDTVIDAFNMAMRRRIGAPRAPGLVVHSDRGVQYTCKEFTTLLTKAQVTRSNSRKANCWDNAVAESFFKTLKCELVYRFKNLLTAQRMRTEIFQYIECWYNKKRRHSALGNLNIEEFYIKFYANKKLVIAS